MDGTRITLRTYCLQLRGKMADLQCAEIAGRARQGVRFPTEFFEIALCCQAADMADAGPRVGEEHFEEVAQPFARHHASDHFEAGGINCRAVGDRAVGPSWRCRVRRGSYCPGRARQPAARAGVSSDEPRGDVVEKAKEGRVIERLR